MPDGVFGEGGGATNQIAHPCTPTLYKFKQRLKMIILWWLKGSLLYLFAIINNHKVYNRVAKKCTISETTCMKPSKINYLEIQVTPYEIYLLNFSLPRPFATEGYFEVVIKIWLEGNLNQRQLNSV